MNDIKTTAIAIISGLAILLFVMVGTYYVTKTSTDRKWKEIIAQAQIQQKEKEAEWQKQLNQLTVKQKKELDAYIASHNYKSCDSEKYNKDYLETITSQNSLIDKFNQQ